MVGGTDTFEFTGSPRGRDLGLRARTADVPGNVHLDRGGEGRLGPDLDRLRRLELDGRRRDTHGDVQGEPWETVTCTFTNERRVGSIVVEKQTDPDGHPQSFDFDASYDASGFSLSDGEQNDSGALLPGTYAVSENPSRRLESLGHLLGQVRPGCDRPLRGRGRDLCSRTPRAAARPGDRRQKSASPTSLKEPGGLVTFSVTIKNVSVVNVAIEEVVDDKFGDLDDEGGNGCFDVPVNLMPMESVNCTFQRDHGAGRDVSSIRWLRADSTPSATSSSTRTTHASTSPRG